MIKEVLDAIGSISNIFGVIGGVFAFLVWVNLRKQQKALIDAAKKTPPLPEFTQAVEYHRKVQTTNPFALAISLLPTTGSIKKEVEGFLESLGSDYAKIPVEEIDIDGIDPQKNLEDFINRVRAKRRELDVRYATEIHLFIAGPVIAGTLIGAAFDHWKPVKLYHKNNITKRYEYWCPLIK